MNQEAIDVLKLKRTIVNDSCMITHNDLGRALQKLVDTPGSGWAFHSGKRLRSSWGGPASDPLTQEDFCKGPHREPDWRKRNSRDDLLFTFEGMIECTLMMPSEEGDDIIKVVVHDGEGLSGRYIGMRCEVYVRGPWWLLKPVQQRIEEKFINLCQHHEAQEEAHRRAQRVIAIYDELLAGKYVPVNNEEDDE